MADHNPTSNYQQSGGFSVEDLQTAAYMFAGLAMMLNIRLSYSAAPFALLRFKLPENLFSVFVRTTSSALELWCIPSMLLGNIMEQVYNQTQNTSSVHRHGITITDLKNKASQLKGTATSQFTSELGHTNQTDLQHGNIPQSGLTKKAGELRDKAKTLNKVANEIVKAANQGSPLKPLSVKATALKDATGTKGTGTGLYQAADDLANKQTAENVGSEANAVIKAFETVEQEYTKLITKAKESKLTHDGKVIEVVKAYHAVKSTYYQMLIRYKIKNKAENFHIAANNLKSDAQGAVALGTALGKLHTAATEQMTQLVAAANNLRVDADKLEHASDSNIVTNYLAVAEKYDALEKIPQFTEAQGERQVTMVKTAFEALQKSYVNVLKLRVQELAHRADNLKTKAGELSKDPTLTALKALATLLATAASSAGTGLQEKANQLVSAINGPNGGTNEANSVIQQFELVRDAYKALAAKANEKGKKSETKVQAVVEAYDKIKKVYDKILIFTKIEYYPDKLETAANPSDVKASEVITNFNAVVAAYKLLGQNEQLIVQTEFDALQTEYSEAIYKYKFHFLTIPSMITNWLNFLTFVILLIVFVTGGDNGHVTAYYVIMAISGFVFGINMVLVYAVDYRYLAFYMAGENSFPMVTSLILYFATSIFGNRRKYNSDYLVVVIDVSIAILIAFVASVLWTVAFYNYRTPMYGDMTPDPWPLVSPVAMVIVGMGLVYSIYPGIAPGMIVPFYLIDKIEMVLLVATAFPPVIIAILRKYKPSWSPSTDLVFPGFGGWKTYEYASQFGGPKDTTVYAWIWHLFDILIPLKIGLAVIFIYSIHYRDSSISRSIVNQPKMSTFLTIVFYMCHEILLALGFPGMVANGGAGGAVLLPVQYVGALLMVFLAFYSIGYITEYKRHDPSQWPTEGMTKWNALCYWLKMASKITNKNFKQLFTTDLRRDLLLCIQKNELI